MDKPLRSTTSTIDIYIKLAQYPILSDEIRRRMRQELFERGVLTQDVFESEVEEQAIESQRREGVYDPFNAESFSVWEERKNRIRNFHTDFQFAYNMPHDRFQSILDEVLAGKREEKSLDLMFNPEVAPWSMLFEQGLRYEALPPNERKEVQHHLEEIKVVLIRGMITDQLQLIGVAKKVLDIRDLQNIFNRRIGNGKIGGKAAGMIIAWKILQQRDPALGFDISARVEIPESYFLGTNVMYAFRQHNNLENMMNQKYKPLDQIRDEYPRIVREHLEGDFSAQIVDKLGAMLEKVGDKPVIVRSSSLLEDNFGSSFAGKYESHFCPNQGTPEENLNALMDAIKRVYASTLNPDALLYRTKHGLIDYDERMAILIQEVRGEQFGDFYFPTLAGVGFSQNPFRWNPKIRKEEGFLRLVWGMGTRAVDRVSADYPRLISLSHPRLRPETTPKVIRQYSQHHIDLINLKENRFDSLPIDRVLSGNYKFLRYVASVEKEGYIRELVSALDVDDPHDLVLTFDSLTKDQQFTSLMRSALMRLEACYEAPVDVEFTVRIVPKYPKPEYRLFVLQCRPLSQRADGGEVEIPQNVPESKKLFSEFRFVPNGKVEHIRYVVFVDPDRYREIPNRPMKLEVGRVVGRLNKLLEKETFILMGPGRWGSANLDLGVRVGYADIYNTKVLIEIAARTEDGGRPELSYGTHFFQDLVEAGIYALPLHLDHPRSQFKWEFFRNAQNVLTELSPIDAEMADYVHVIDLAREVGSERLTIAMNGGSDEALGYLCSIEGHDEGSADNGNINHF